MHKVWSEESRCRGSKPRFPSARGKQLPLKIQTTLERLPFTQSLIGIALMFQIRLMEVLILFGKKQCCFSTLPKSSLKPASETSFRKKATNFLLKDHMDWLMVLIPGLVSPWGVSVSSGTHDISSVKSPISSSFSASPFCSNRLEPASPGQWFFPLVFSWDHLLFFHVFHEQQGQGMMDCVSLGLPRWP